MPSGARSVHTTEHWNKNSFQVSWSLFTFQDTFQATDIFVSRAIQEILDIRGKFIGIMLRTQ